MAEKLKKIYIWNSVKYKIHRIEKVELPILIEYTIQIVVIKNDKLLLGIQKTYTMRIGEQYNKID